MFKYFETYQNAGFCKTVKKINKAFQNVPEYANITCKMSEMHKNPQVWGKIEPTCYDTRQNLSILQNAVKHSEMYKIEP